MARIHTVHKKLFGKFREKRMRMFVNEIKPQASEMILDVGGAWYTWSDKRVARGHVLLINKTDFDYQICDDICEDLDVSFKSGDATDLEFENGSFPIAYSNSVIEHVGNYAAQQRFASEILRVGKKVWVQTPAREFVVEPHYMTLFVHWLTPAVQKKILRWVSLWGWVQRPDKQYISQLVDEIRLIRRCEMVELFPNCRIIEEKVLGIFTKSYIAVRD